MNAYCKNLIIFFTILTLLSSNSYAQHTHTAGKPWPGHKGYYVLHYPNGGVKEEGIRADSQYINDKNYLPRHIIRYNKGIKSFEVWCGYREWDTLQKHFLFIPYQKEKYYHSEDTAIVYDSLGRIRAKGPFKITDSTRSGTWNYYSGHGRLVKQVYYSNDNTPLYERTYYPSARLKSFCNYQDKYCMYFTRGGSLDKISYLERYTTDKRKEEYVNLSICFSKSTGHIVTIEHCQYPDNPDNACKNTFNLLSWQPESYNNYSGLATVRKRHVLKFKTYTYDPFLAQKESDFKPIKHKRPLLLYFVQ